MRAVVVRASTLAFVAATSFLIGIGLLTYNSQEQISTTRGWVRHTYDVLGNISTLIGSVHEAASDQRGYLLSRDEQFLTSFHQSLGRISQLHEELIRLTADDSQQQERLQALGSSLQKLRQELSRATQLHHDAVSGAAQGTSQVIVGSPLLDEIEANLTAAAAQEQRLLTSRIAATDRAAAHMRWLTSVTTGAAVLTLACAFWLLSRALLRTRDAELAEREQAIQLHASLNSLSQGVAVFDHDRCLVEWNHCFGALLDLPAPLLRKGVAYSVIAAHLAQASRGPFLETDAQITQGQVHHSQMQPIIFERRTADDRSFELRRTPMPNHGLVLTVSETTERVLAEVVQRDAHKMQAIGQLTGGIAHDFNNLLAAVLGNLDLAAAQLETDHPAAIRLQRAISGAQRGATLTQQLLAFARRQPLKPEPVNLSVALRDMMSLLERTLGAPIEIRFIESAGLWEAMADRVQVESALLNLVLNARDAMPEGGRLTIELANKVLDGDYAARHQEVTPGEYVMLAVTDTGCGMSPDIVAKAFEPFYTTKPVGKGTGLGLAMVHGFAKQSGGHVKIYSEVGEGTSVKAYLPRATKSLSSGRQTHSAPVVLPDSSATVLVLEDAADVREVTALILRSLGYHVLEAEDGEEALRVFHAHDKDVDLLLADIVLPGRFKGHEIAKQITAAQPRTKVIYMSGYTENAIVHHGRVDEGVHLLSKPFKREELARKVADVLMSDETFPPHV